MFRSLFKRLTSSNTSSVGATVKEMSGPRVKSITDLPDASYEGKVVFVRVDYNVTIEKIDSQYIVKPTSYGRINGSLHTIQYLADRGAKLVLASHLGDPKGDNMKLFSLAPVAKVLKENLPYNINFVEDCIGPKVTEAISQLANKDVLLLDNLRYHKGEKKNDPEFISQLLEAINPDIYVNDAFGTAHRAHASVFGVPEALHKKNIPCLAGQLMVDEVKYLSDVIPTTRQQDTVFTSILGGAKVTSKLPLFKHLLPRVNRVLVGGAMALPFLKAQGYSISNVDDESVKAATEIMELAKKYDTEIILPVDFATSFEFADRDIKHLKEPIPNTLNADIVDGMYCLDIGVGTQKLFAEAIYSSDIIVWNGPMGKFEWPAYCQGSLEMVRSISKSMTKKGRISVVGGGETAQVVDIAENINIPVMITHVSTGGGASLAMLQGETLPAVTALDMTE